MTRDHTSSSMSEGERSAKVSRPPDPAGLRDSQGEVDPKKLSAALRRDRLRLKMSWPAYSDHMGVPMATLYKIARQVSKPQELTVQKILDRWAELNDEATAGVQPGASDMVSSR